MVNSGHSIGQNSPVMCNIKIRPESPPTPRPLPVPLPEDDPVLVRVSAQGAVAGRDDPVPADQRGPAERLHTAGDGVRAEPGGQLSVGSSHYRNTST